MFKYELHIEVCKAIIKAVKKRKPNEYDNKKTYQIIKDYFYGANKGAVIGFCFCPDDEEIIRMMDDNIKYSKNRL